ncbi:hypothetical protein HYDPIDRAFT_24936 [Hydnomerulius pinastri MD-312]|nr:hypothetical protein HYDPIDRAFT_24936 [Hydnomerulius pinastri MD-312]
MDINDLHPSDDYSHRFFIWHEWIQASPIASRTLDATKIANGPLTTENVFDYFATSMFYDKQSNNQVLRMQTMHTGMPILNESEELKRFTGIEFALAHAQPPSLFIIQKRERLSPEEVRPLAAYFIMNNRIYQSPDVYTVLSNRLLTSLNSLQSSLDVLRKYRPDYTPRTGFVWPIVDSSLPDDANKKQSSEDVLPSSGGDSDSATSILEKQKPITGPTGPKKQQNNMLMLFAMRTTAMHSNITSSSRAMALDGESNAPESQAAGSGQRSSATPAPPGTRGATPKISSSGPTPQPTAPTKGPAGGGKKKKKRTSLAP